MPFWTTTQRERAEARRNLRGLMTGIKLIAKHGYQQQRTAKPESDIARAERLARIERRARAPLARRVLVAILCILASVGITAALMALQR